MRVCAGLYRAKHGFKFLDYIEIIDVEQWILAMDCQLMITPVINWDGEIIPSTEVSTIIIHDHAIDQMFNALCGTHGRNFEPGAAI